MAKRTRETVMTIEDQSVNGEISVDYEPALILSKGFYFIDEDLNLKTKSVTKGKPGQERRIEFVPICSRTIGGARDVVSASGSALAILCVTEDGFRYQR